MALILGIYPRFIAALTNIDLNLLKSALGFLKSGGKGQGKDDFIAALKKSDITFLIALGIGIVAAFASLARVIPSLLKSYPAHMNGFFFGMILASVIIPFRMMNRRGPIEAIAFVAATIFAFWITGLAVLQVQASTPFLFVCGAIAISAMLLPGISGSFLLLIMGQYEYLLTSIRDRKILVLAVFAAGMGTGLLVFSRFLRWLLGKYPAPTLAALCGLMIGSLRKIWPYKVALENPVIIAGKTLAAARNVLPNDPAYQGSVVAPLVLFVVGFVLVNALNWLGTRNVR